MSIYRTKSGDTWDKIAYDLYEDESCMTQLIASNREYAYICVFDSGYVLQAPDIVQEEVDEALPDWRQE